jgi:hypothetical protein
MPLRRGCGSTNTSSLVMPGASVPVVYAAVEIAGHPLVPGVAERPVAAMGDDVVRS